MARWTVAVTLLVLGGAACVSTGEAAAPEGDGCTVDGDCPSGQVCIDGSCGFARCQDDASCGADERCMDGACVPVGGGAGGGGGGGGAIVREPCARLEAIAPRFRPFAGLDFGALESLQGLGAYEGAAYTASLIREHGELVMLASASAPLRGGDRSRPYRWRIDGPACVAGDSRTALPFTPEWLTAHGGLGRLRPFEGGFVAASTSDETGSYWWDPWPAFLDRVGDDLYTPPVPIAALWDAQFCAFDGAPECDGIYGLDPVEDAEGLRLLLSRASPQRVLWEVPCTRGGGLDCDFTSGRRLELPGEPVVGGTIRNPLDGAADLVVQDLQYKEPRLACEGAFLFFVRRGVGAAPGSPGAAVWDELRRAPVLATRPALLLGPSEPVTAGGAPVAKPELWSFDLTDDCGLLVVSGRGTLEMAVAP